MLTRSLLRNRSASFASPYVKNARPSGHDGFLFGGMTADDTSTCRVAALSGASAAVESDPTDGPGSGSHPNITSPDNSNTRARPMVPPLNVHTGAAILWLVIAIARR